MLGREVIEGEQIGPVLGQAFDRPVVFHAVGLDEEIEGALASALVSAIQMSFRCALALGCTDFGMALSTFAVL
jgi:hypothetical protein